MEEMGGDRVRLRPWRTEDAAFVYDLYSRRDVVQYLGHEPKVMSEPARAEALLARLRATNDPVLGYWAVEASETKDLLGTVMLQNIRPSGTEQAPIEVEIGWHFHPAAWGRGYATEAAKLLLQHGFSSGVKQIIAVALPANSASHRICRRLGMTDEGITDRYYDADYNVFAARSISD
jgi:RimJ/RimL family protein N-acetyltransferase